MDPRLVGCADVIDGLAGWLSKQQDPELVRLALERLKERIAYFSQEDRTNSQLEETGFYVDQRTGQKLTRAEFRERLSQALADCPRETWWQRFLGRFGIYL